jgi:chemotaxis protein CheD
MTAAVMDVFLQPGECYFGEAGTRIRTLLGSCISVTMWHPQRRIGGMVHCLLPARDVLECAEPDGRFVDEALLWLMREAVREHTDPAGYRIKLFGGANMFARLGLPNAVQVGRKNSDTATRILECLGLAIDAHDVGKDVYRSIIFDISSGAVWVRCGDANGETNSLETMEA